jgi:hypothetical protein
MISCRRSIKVPVTARMAGALALSRASSVRWTATVGKSWAGTGGGSQVGPHGNDGGLKRGMFNLHGRGVLNGNKPDLAGSHQLLDRRIADGADAEDRFCLPVEECAGGGLIILADKLEVLPAKTKVLHDSEERLKLSSALGQGNPPALQIDQAFCRRILRHQKLEGVVVKNGDRSRPIPGQNVGLCGGQLRAAILEHLQVLDCPACLEESNADPGVVALYNRFQRAAQQVAFPAGCTRSQGQMFHF